jgi:hypothetical protein
VPEAFKLGRKVYDFFMRSIGTTLIGAVWLCSLGSSCGGDGRTPCTGMDDQTTCGPNAVCLWIHDGSSSGYLCATTCTTNKPCPAGQSCKAGGASSCDVCQDLVDICK